MRKGPKNDNFKAHRKKQLKRWRQTDVGKAHLAASMKARRIERAKWLWEYKSSLSCSKCGFDEHPAALQFHHTSSDKIGEVGALLRAGRIKTARAEMEKCVVLCANCHAILHYEERVKRSII